MVASVNLRTRLLSLLMLRRIKRRRRGRRFYVAPVNVDRPRLGEYNILIEDLRRRDHERFFKLFRMYPDRFDKLHDLVAPYIEHARTHADPIDTRHRLAVTLRILASGDSPQQVAIQYRMGKSTVGGIFRETCAAIWNALQDRYVPYPTEEAFRNCINDFWKLWNFPMCAGAIDGKHIIIKCPKNSGSMYYNYKHSFSILLMACVDAHYRFTMVDIGGYGSQGDPGTFSDSTFGKSILDGTIPLPPPQLLPGTNIPFPAVFIADEAFPLRVNLMRPFPRAQLTDERRIYNYRLSRARRIVENAFGIMTARWRILLRPIEASPPTVDQITRACVALHNFMRSHDPSVLPSNRYVPPNFDDTEDTNSGEVLPGNWRADHSQALVNLGQLSSNAYKREAAATREKLAQYFTSDAGTVPWQELSAFAC